MEMHIKLGIPTNEQIDKLRSKLNKIDIKVSEKYLDFLKQNGGGQPLKESFIDTTGKEIFINCFWGISDNLSLDLYHFVVTLLGIVPKGLMPIGTDGIGNIICIGIEKQNLDKVYIWWENEGQEIVEDPSYDNVEQIANSFDELISLL